MGKKAQKVDPHEYVCSVCDKSFTRADSAKTHAKQFILSTHPLGYGTPVIKRLRPCSNAPETSEDACEDACDILQEFVAVVAKLAKTLDADKEEFLALSKRLSNAVKPSGQNVNPECMFALEQIPPKNELKRRLLDIFTFGVVPHIVWTHVHKHKTVRKSDSCEHLRTYGIHGWTTRPTYDVAIAALERMQTRLEKMWLALKREDPKGAAVLKPAMKKFAERKTIYMDGVTFDMDYDVVASKDAVDKLVTELSMSLEEYAILL